MAATLSIRYCPKKATKKTDLSLVFDYIQTTWIQKVWCFLCPRHVSYIPSGVLYRPYIIYFSLLDIAVPANTDPVLESVAHNETIIPYGPIRDTVHSRCPVTS